ncbi:MAG: pyridoxal-dependent decarboxylase [bacterium]|nr:pyridoxal-dependent decarboxylase [bacterium]
MNTKLDLKWSWPASDRNLPVEVVSALEEIMAGNSAQYSCSDRVIMSFPGTTVHPIAAEICRRIIEEHPNNIGLHTAGVSEEGFKGSQQAEINAIRWLSELLGDGQADGYFNSGGTEANIMGLWIGRNFLLKEFGDPLDKRICVFASFLTHYSIRKGCNILGLGEGDYRPCTECQVLDHFFHPERDGSGLHFVPTDRFGAISTEPNSMDGDSALEHLRRCIERKVGQGFKRFILVANAGTTMTGGVDDIMAMGDMVDKLKEKHNDVGFFLHVDAAFGGFVGPFLANPIPCGFAHPAVQSVTVDPHKMGLAPYPCGGFLCRKGLTRWVKRDVGYVGGHLDCTLTGSRSGATAVASSLLFQYLGKQGYERIIQNTMAVTEALRDALSRIPKVKVLPSRLNILPVAFDKPELDRVLFEHDRLKHKEEYSTTNKEIDSLKICERMAQPERKLAEAYFQLQRKYTLMGEWLPEDLGDLKSHPRRIHKIVIMPHSWVRIRAAEVIDEFVSDISELLEL